MGDLVGIFSQRANVRAVKGKDSNRFFYIEIMKELIHLRHLNCGLAFLISHGVFIDWSHDKEFEK